MGKVALLLPALLFACQAVSSVNLQRNDLFELAGLAYVMSRDTVRRRTDSVRVRMLSSIWSDMVL